MAVTRPYARRNQLPLLVRTFVKHGYLVGSAASWLIGETDQRPQDFDIVIPLANWRRVVRYIPYRSQTNSFGGVKLAEAGFGGPGTVIDVWAQDIDDYLRRSTGKHAGLAVAPLTGDGFVLRLEQPFSKGNRRLRK